MLAVPNFGLPSPALLFMLLAAPAAEVAQPVEPPPGWVDELLVSREAPLPKEGTRWGIHFLLIDHQVKAAGRATASYNRRVWKVLTSSGVQSTSELETIFDPTYQRFVIHHVRLLRGEHLVDALRPGDVKIVHQETDLSSRIYNGSVTAFLPLKDGALAT
jgi:hypothetical protein